MANTLINPSMIAKEALFQLENNCVFGDKVHREYRNEFVKIGDSVSIRKPVKFKAKDGATRVNQDVHEPTTNITIDQRKHVSWKFSSQDLTLTIEEYSERYIKPAMITLANEIDLSVATEGALEFFNAVGTPGTTPANFSALADVAQRMDESAVPDDGMRRIVLNPAARWAMANGLGGTGSAGVFNADIVGDMVRKGWLGRIANFDIYGDQNVYTHTVGAQGGTPLVNGVPSVGVNGLPNESATTTVAFDGGSLSTSGYLKRGDVVTFAGVYAVNPISYQSTGQLAQFVVTADVATDGTGAGSMLLRPAMNAGGVASYEAYQNVTALPADNAAITVLGSGGGQYPQNLGFHRNALALVTVPLELPDSASFKARADWRGYSIRIVKDYDIDADEEIIRLDILYGVKAIYRDLGVRLFG